MTLRQLAAHQGGVRHYAGAEAPSNAHHKNLAASLRIFTRYPLAFTPGTDFLYSSYGFNLIGVATERVREASYADALRTEVLAPLGLTRTGIDDPHRSGTATFYEVRDDRSAVRAPAVDLSNRYPSGGLVSTAEETARFASKVGDPAFLKKAVQRILFESSDSQAGVDRGPGAGRSLEARSES